MKIGVILGSTRQGRMTERLAKWVMKNNEQLPNVAVELLDLRDYPMPFFDEPRSPKANPDRHINPVAQKWLAKLKEKDAYIIVTPEYNHAIPGVLKNAIDYIDWQVHKKPFAVVSHGSTGGARATGNLKQIISEARAFVISTNVAITMRVGEIFDEQGNLSAEISKQELGPHVTIKQMLNELVWYANALKTAREQS